MTTTETMMTRMIAGTNNEDDPWKVVPTITLTSLMQEHSPQINQVREGEEEEALEEEEDYGLDDSALEVSAIAWADTVTV